MSDTMTVKELAEVAGVSQSTIRRAAKTAGVECVNGIAQTFDHEQALNVVASIRVKASRKITPSQNGKVALQNDKVQPEIVKAFADALQIMNKLATESAESNAMTRRLIEGMSARQVIAPPEQEYSTVSGYCRRNGIHVDLETAISNERGYPIRKISDQRWGEVNTYHVNVLAQAVAA